MLQTVMIAGIIAESSEICVLRTSCSLYHLISLHDSLKCLQATYLHHHQLTLYQNVLHGSWLSFIVTFSELVISYPCANSRSAVISKHVQSTHVHCNSTQLFVLYTVWGAVTKEMKCTVHFDCHSENVVN